MPRILAALLAAALALTATVAPVAAHQALTQISLPNGWQPEGIAAAGRHTAFVGSLANGAIARINLRTGVVDPTFVASASGPAVGLEYERRGHRLWVAGGPTGQVRVYDARSGALLQTYTFTAGFLNDLVVTRDAVYVTDSFIQQLVVIPLGARGALPQPAQTFTRPIQAPFTYLGAGAFNANGIVAVGGSLLIPQSATGKLFAVNPATGASRELLPAGSIPAADGLEVRGRTLYVVQNALNQISVFSIRGDRLTLRRTITSPTFDFPTTAAAVGRSLWVVNARFSTTPTPTTPYWITRVPAR